MRGRGLSNNSICSKDASIANVLCHDQFHYKLKHTALEPPQVLPSKVDLHHGWRGDLPGSSSYVFHTASRGAMMMGATASPHHRHHHHHLVGGIVIPGGGGSGVRTAAIASSSSRGGASKPVAKGKKVIDSHRTKSLHLLQIYSVQCVGCTSFPLVPLLLPQTHLTAI